MALRGTNSDEDDRPRGAGFQPGFQPAEGFSPTSPSDHRSVFSGAEAHSTSDAVFNYRSSNCCSRSRMVT